MSKEINEKELQILKARFVELAEKSQYNGIYTYTEFLGLLEQNLYHSMEKELKAYAPSPFGGINDSERIVIRFGDSNSIGYEEEYPITPLLISPISLKFSEELSHRDVLGALMNLGIKRSLLGDIYIKESKILIFCLDKIADFLKENLFKIRHTEVNVEDFTGNLSDYSGNTKEVDIQISSERLDAVISKVFHLSRDKAQELFKKNLVFVNGRQIQSFSYTPKSGDKITTRGFGRMTYIGLKKTTKKGNLLVSVDLNT